MSPKQVREFRSDLEKFEILKTLNMSLLLRNKIWKSAVKRFDNPSFILPKKWAGSNISYDHKSSSWRRNYVLLI